MLGSRESQVPGFLPGRESVDIWEGNGNNKEDKKLAKKRKVKSEKSKKIKANNIIFLNLLYMERLKLKERAYLFSLAIIKFIDQLDQNHFVIKEISRQLIRSATSIGANIIEAQAGSSRKDFANFFNYSLKSANETKYWIALLRDSDKASKEKCNGLLKEVTELANILGASVVTLRKKKRKEE